MEEENYSMQRYDVTGIIIIVVVVIIIISSSSIMIFIH